MHKINILATVSLFLLCSCDYFNKKEAPVHQHVPAIATVNGTEISFPAFKQIYLSQKIDLTGAEGPIATARQVQKEAILEDQINQLLLLQAAEKHQIKVKDEDLEDLFKTMTADWDASELEKELALRGLTIDNFKDNIRKNLLISSYLSQEVYARVDVSDQELLDKYQQNPALYTQEEAINLRQILVPSEELANEVIAALGKGAKFADVAGEYSVASDSHNGGSMGWIKKGNLSPELEEVVFALKPGKISDIITSQYGYHIFLVEEKSPQKNLKFDQVKNAIEQTVRSEKEQEAQNGVIEELRSAAAIKINNDLLDHLD